MNKLLQDSLQTQRWRADLARRQKIRMYLDFYHNRPRPYLEKMIDTMVDREEARELKKYLEHDNVTQRIIEDISLVFNDKPAIGVFVRDETGRLIPNTQAQNRLDDLLTRANFFVTLKEVEKLTKLTFDVAVLPQTRDHRVELDIITPDKAFVEQDSEDPTKARSFYYQVGIRTDTPRPVPVEVYHCWSRQGKFACELTPNGLPIDSVPLPHIDYGGRLPVVMFRNYLPIDTFWREADNNIVEKNIAIDLKRTDLSMAEAYNIPQRVNKGVPQDQQLKIGRTFTLNIPANDMGEAVGDSYFVHPRENLLQQNDLILNRIEQLGLSMGLSRSVITGQTATSGYELALSKYEIVERNRRERVYYLEPTLELLRLMVITARKGLGWDFPDNLVFTVDFPEIEFARSADEQERSLSWRYANGLLSTVDLLMETNPDLDRNAAIARLRQIRSEESELGSHIVE